MSRQYLTPSSAWFLTLVLLSLVITAGAARAQDGPVGVPSLNTVTVDPVHDMDAEAPGLVAPPLIRQRTNAQLFRGRLITGSEVTLRPALTRSLLTSLAAEIARGIKSPVRHSAVVAQQSGSPNRNWIQRHPVLFGSLVGFGAGFLVGYLPGDDAVFEDYTAEFNGLVIGGIGAGAGAVVGWAVSR